MVFRILDKIVVWGRGRGCQFSPWLAYRYFSQGKNLDKFQMFKGRKIKASQANGDAFIEFLGFLTERKF